MFIKSLFNLSLLTSFGMILFIPASVNGYSSLQREEKKTETLIVAQTSPLNSPRPIPSPGSPSLSTRNAKAYLNRGRAYSMWRCYQAVDRILNCCPKFIMINE